MNESVVTSTNEILTSTTVQSTSDLPRYLFKLEPPKGHRQDKTDMTNSVSTDTDYQPQTKVPVTTEFLATELTTPSPKRKSYRERGRKNKYAPTTTPKPREQIPGTDVYHAPTSPIFDDSALSSGANSQVDNSPVDQENYSKDTLDALLVYLPTPKVPEMIAWTSKIPIRMAYFGFTIIEGSLGKQRRLKEKGHRRAKGARIYVRGLGMPVGYTQVTQVCSSCLNLNLSTPSATFRAVRWDQASERWPESWIQITMSPLLNLKWELRTDMELLASKCAWILNSDTDGVLGELFA